MQHNNENRKKTQPNHTIAVCKNGMNVSWLMDDYDEPNHVCIGRFACYSKSGSKWLNFQLIITIIKIVILFPAVWSIGAEDVENLKKT